MAFLETKHTLSRVERIKKDLSKITSIISYLSMVVFMAYYIFLAIKNLNSYIYLAIYSCMILLILALFIVEVSIKEERKFLRNEKRLATERKRDFKLTIKTIKFIAKAILVGIAIYETFTNFNLSFPNIVNIVSVIMLMLQVLLEIIIHYIIKQIDYFRLSVELDLQESGSVIRGLSKKLFPLKVLEEEAIAVKQKPLHSPQEEKMIETIKKEAEGFVQIRDKREAELRKIIESKEKPPKKFFRFIKSKKDSSK